MSSGCKLGDMAKQKRSGVIFRWAGSKARVLEQLMNKIDDPNATPNAPSCRRWVEPFVGGCSVALEAMRRGLAKEYVLSDALPEIKAVLNTLADDALRPVLFSALKYHQNKHVDDQKADWNAEREEYCEYAEQKAFRFLILQASSFNGLWRLNSKGQYNVPFGRAASFDFAALEEAAKLLRANPVNIHCQDFAETIAWTGPGDIVYADPPYIDQFSSYSAARFSQDEHARLSVALKAAARRGAECWVSNSDTEVVRDIYRGEVYEIQARRSISCKSATRGVKKELLIRVGAA